MSLESFDRLRAKMVPAIAKEMFIQTKSLADYIKSRALTGGTTRTKLAVRSGRLRASIKPARVKTTRTTVTGGINVGTVYGPTHFGKRGSKTTIVPKAGKKFLTIPTKFAKTPSGVSRGSALSGMWGETFVARSKKGNLLIFGKRVGQRGASAGQARGKIVPLFLLVKKVQIPARVDPMVLARLWRPRMIRALGRLTVKVVGEVR